MTKNPMLHARTKHIELDLYFVRDKVLQRDLIVNHVPSFDQTADIFTKPLSTPRFLFLRSKLNVTDRSLSLRGHIRSISADGVTTGKDNAHAISKEKLTDAESKAMHSVHKQPTNRTDHERWNDDQCNCHSFIIIIIIIIRISSGMNPITTITYKTSSVSTEVNSEISLIRRTSDQRMLEDVRGAFTTWPSRYITF
ncbi:hypothetical protein ACOSQ2_024495 [Xanthoceras sorbifolium]